jgi:hypothetical protein
MCRLAAYPPGTTPDEAKDVMRIQCANNKDGTGSAFIRDGSPVIHKWPVQFDEVVKANLPLYDHMPHNGWTISHVRTKTHGEVAIRNTHPFTHGDWTVCHNGTWSEYWKIRKLLRKRRKFIGETDSEVAAALIDELGPEEFFDYIDNYPGVFLCLNKSGHLWVVKKGGSLNWSVLPGDKYMLASDLRMPFKYVSVPDGWYHFGSDGLKIEDSKPEWPKVYDFREHKFQNQYPRSIDEVADMDGFEGTAWDSALWKHGEYERDKRQKEAAEDVVKFQLNEQMKKDGFYITSDGSVVSAGPEPCPHGIRPKDLCLDCNPPWGHGKQTEHRDGKVFIVGSICKHKNLKGKCLNCLDELILRKPKFSKVPTVEELHTWLSHDTK